ncbi:hypothetical protein CI1B_39250 [Bradyrhizobium ivorense]|uniref:Uncharacterized protein n=1 Tax=Bradyrhizobium ivorense TaxID=2511166 RepID=A0A508TD34_9BRAD|nr:hypothetical protein CI1B_39250 [Bradyrhizobium ivorense]
MHAVGVGVEQLDAVHRGRLVVHEGGTGIDPVGLAGGQRDGHVDVVLRHIATAQHFLDNVLARREIIERPGAVGRRRRGLERGVLGVVIEHTVALIGLQHTVAVQILVQVDGDPGDRGVLTGLLYAIGVGVEQLDAVDRAGLQIAEIEIVGVLPIGQRYAELTFRVVGGRLDPSRLRNLADRIGARGDKEPVIADLVGIGGVAIVVEVDAAGDDRRFTRIKNVVVVEVQINGPAVERRLGRRLPDVIAVEIIELVAVDDLPDLPVPFLEPVVVGPLAGGRVLPLLVDIGIVERAGLIAECRIQVDKGLAGVERADRDQHGHVGGVAAARLQAAVEPDELVAARVEIVDQRGVVSGRKRAGAGGWRGSGGVVVQGGGVGLPDLQRVERQQGLVGGVELIDIELEAIVADAIDEFDRQVGKLQRMDEVGAALAGVVEQEVVEVGVVTLHLIGVAADLREWVKQTRTGTDCDLIAREDCRHGSAGDRSGGLERQVDQRRIGEARGRLQAERRLVRRQQEGLVGRVGVDVP